MAGALATATGIALAAAVLEGIAVLPAETRMPGPDSGHSIAGLPGVEPPFEGQPLQGVSSVVAESADALLVLTDNGYGTRANSADFLLRIYSVAPEFRTAAGGDGVVRVNGFITLRDPFDFSGFERVSDGDAADPSLAAHGWLTGADFDPESLVRHPDGTFWIGDEFGPFLLHFSADGRLLDPPYALPGLASPDRPGADAPVPTVGRSRGFEGLALTADGRYLHPMLEAGLEESPGVLGIYTFDIEERRFLNDGALDPTHRYRLEREATSIGEFILIAPDRALVVERDAGEGAAAAFKKVFSVQFSDTLADGSLVKAERVDLLDIHDPDDLDRDGEKTFSFPHQTIESLAVLGADRLLVINDNNYPFGRARSGERPDATEFIVVRVAEPW